MRCAPWHYEEACAAGERSRWHLQQSSEAIPAPASRQHHAHTNIVPVQDTLHAHQGGHILPSIFSRPARSPGHRTSRQQAACHSVRTASKCSRPTVRCPEAPEPGMRRVAAKCVPRSCWCCTVVGQPSTAATARNQAAPECPAVRRAGRRPPAGACETDQIIQSCHRTSQVHHESQHERRIAYRMSRTS